MSTASSPASGLEFALLPADNATGNFTKIVQRVPVKIVLDDKALAGRLRPRACRSRRPSTPGVSVDGRRAAMTPPCRLRSWIAVVGSTIGTFMAIINVQIVNASLGDIQGAIGAASTRAADARPPTCGRDRRHPAHRLALAGLLDAPAT